MLQFPVPSKYLVRLESTVGYGFLATGLETPDEYDLLRRYGQNIRPSRKQQYRLSLHRMPRLQLRPSFPLERGLAVDA